MARTVVKFYCDDGEIFRRQLPEPTFEAIVELVTNFRLDVKAHMLHEGRACALKYADDEGDQCVLTPSTFSDFLALQTVDQPLKLQLKLPSTKEGLDHQRLNKESEAKGRGTGCGGKGMKRSKLDISDAPRDVPQDVPIQDSYRTDGLGAAGSVAEGGGLRKFLLSLRVLQESGSVTAERLASLLVAWIPSLAAIAERRSEQLKDLAKNGLNPPLQNMLAVIQEQAAATPHLKRYAAVLAKVLSGEIDQRRLGKALPNMMKALQELETEVQSRFCEGVARSLLPHMEEISQLPIGCRNKGKGKGKCKGKGSGKEQGKTEERSKLDDVAKQQLVSEGGGLRKFLLNLRTLQEAGSVTAERLASLLVAWIPSLAVIAERRSEQLKDLAKNGLNPPLQNMLAVIQEQAATTPRLKRYAAVLAKVLSGEIDQRRLGKALPNMMKALQELETEVQSRFCEGVARSLLPHMEEISQLPIGCRNKGKGKGKCKGKGNGKEQGKTAERSNLDDVAKQQLVSEGGGLRKFLLNLRMLQEAGSVTAERLASLLVAWIPSLARIAERRSEQLKDLAKNGLNPPLQNMLAIIQEQAATTPHLKRYAAVLAKVLAGEIDQRRLGKALPNIMKALQGLEPEVQSRFCEGVAHSLLPHMEELSQLSMGCHKQDKGKGKGKEGKQLKRSKLDYGANANQKPFSEGGGLRKFLLRLRVLQETGSMTSETLASMLMAWIPSLTRIAERRSEQLKDLAQNGLNPPLQKMLAIIQEQAATTPHLKRYAAVLAKVLAGEIHQRRLGKALPNMMKALQGLEPEVSPALSYLTRRSSSSAAGPRQGAGRDA